MPSMRMSARANYHEMTASSSHLEWPSTKHPKADTNYQRLAQIAKLGLSVFVGPEITDIDDIDSANGVAAIAPWLGLDRIINT